MAKLNAQARQALREAGFTQAEWSRMHGGSGGKWTGDQCGCPDDRCANGFHHMGTNDCGCLPVLLEQAVAWREAVRWPNSVELAAPHGLFNWVSVSTSGVLVTVSASAGGIPAGKPAESVIEIEAREDWTAAVGEDERGRMVVRLVRAETPEAGDGGPGDG